MIWEFVIRYSLAEEKRVNAALRTTWKCCHYLVFPDSNSCAFVTKRVKINPSLSRVTLLFDLRKGYFWNRSGYGGSFKPKTFKIDSLFIAVSWIWRFQKTIFPFSEKKVRIPQIEHFNLENLLRGINRAKHEVAWSRIDRVLVIWSYTSSSLSSSSWSGWTLPVDDRTPRQFY